MTTDKKFVPILAQPRTTLSARSASCEPPGGGVSTELLLGDRTELKIRHNGETYSLRKTRLNKLILTK